MRTPLMDSRSSITKPRGGSTVSMRKYNDDTSDSAHNSASDRESRPSRATSPENLLSETDTPRLNKASKPINEAVTSGLNKATDTTHATLAPEVLSAITSQITAQVLQQLQTANLGVSAAASSEQHDPLSASEDIARDRLVYTPSSPEPSNTGTEPTQLSPTFSNFSMASPTSRQPNSPNDRRPLSPYSSGSGHDDSDDSKKFTPRPEAPKRASTYGDLTVMERAWKKLYDENGQPTERLGQFLRGIAVHIIEDYEPKDSLVITPDKMQKYYEEIKLSNEVYPWQNIFDHRTSYISRMLRDLDVPHHLVQEEGKHERRPDIAGLTPRGFEAWFKLVLKARPDLEYERLYKTALHMPISNPDDKKERFPKELSKRLFTAVADPTIAATLEKAMVTHCDVNVPSRRDSVLDPDTKTPVPSQKRSGISPPPAHNLHRSETGSSAGMSRLGRSVTMGASTLSGSAIQDDPEEAMPTKPIERERKPYVAQPGIGRLYEGAAEVTPASWTLSNIETNLPPPSLSKLGRSPSVASAGGTSSRRPTLPITVHQTSNQHWDNSQDAQYRYQAEKRSDRERDRDRSTSASRNKDYPRRSDGHLKTNSYDSNREYEPVVSTYSHGQHGHRSRRSSFNESGRDRRDRDREPRSRKQSVTGPENNKYQSNQGEEDFYRSINGDTGHAPYPPNAYRSKG